MARTRGRHHGARLHERELIAEMVHRGALAPRRRVDASMDSARLVFVDGLLRRERKGADRRV